MQNRLGGASTALLVLKCPVCRMGILYGVTNREGHVVARCSMPGCWGQSKVYGEIAQRP